MMSPSKRLFHRFTLCSILWLLSHCFWTLVPWLVNVELATARQRDFREHAPALILHGSAVDLVLMHLGEEGVDVVAHEKERVAGALRFVHRDFGRRQAEDYVAAVIDARQLEHVAEESEVGLGFLAADDAMRADEHRRSSFMRQSPACASGRRSPAPRRAESAARRNPRGSG